jgi:hypothetical protein
MNTPFQLLIQINNGTFILTVTHEDFQHIGTGSRLSDSPELSNHIIEEVEQLVHQTFDEPAPGEKDKWKYIERETNPGQGKMPWHGLAAVKKGDAVEKCHSAK